MTSNSDLGESSLLVTPDHYAVYTLSPLDVMREWPLDAATEDYRFLRGSSLKYLCRHPFKGQPRRDLEKSIDCQQRMIALLEHQGFV